MLLVVGEIGRPHGIRGEVSVRVRTDEPESRFAAGSVLQTDPAAAGPLTVRLARNHQGGLIVAFEDVFDRNTAEELRGVLLCVDSDTIAAPEDPDEFLDHQLVGLRAVSTDGETLGEVVAIEHAPASELLLVRLVSGRVAMVPFVSAIVPTVSLDAGELVLTPPEGLFDL